MLITGVSSGLGKTLAEEALRQGWTVVGTVRKEADRQKFEAINPGHAIGRILDVTDTVAVPKVVAGVETAISDYARLRKRHDETPLPWNGDLTKAAQAMLTIVGTENPPGHVLLGSIADRLVGQKLETLRKEFAAGKQLSASTDGSTAA